jgi:hypothetical protein
MKTINTNKMTTKERAAYNRANGIVTVRPRMKRNGAAMNDVYNQEWM